MDQLAKQGMSFTDAHSTSSVCTPTRYGILTARYNWRTHLQKSVLMGFSGPLIAENRLTVAGFLKENGYTTGAIGKWHLGMDMPGTAPKKIDWKGTIKNGPVSHGFDYFHGISTSLDMAPYIYIENDHFVGEATAFPSLSAGPRSSNPTQPPTSLSASPTSWPPVPTSSVSTFPTEPVRIA